MTGYGNWKFYSGASGRPRPTEKRRAGSPRPSRALQAQSRIQRRGQAPALQSIAAHRKDLELILDWFEDARPPDEVKAIRALQDFMLAEDIMDNMDEEDEEDEEDGDEVSRRRPGKPSFSFSQDAICIYAAFRAVYGIDLTNIPYMHWWQFLSLLAGLPQDTEIKERIYYRSVDLNTIKSKEERDRIKKIKKLIAIKEPQRRVVDDYEIGDVFA